MATPKSKAVPAARKPRKTPSTKGRKAPTMRELAEIYNVDPNQLTRKQRADVEEWAIRAYGKPWRQAMAVGAIAGVLYQAQPKPEPIPLEKQHAVILSRLKQNGECAEDVLTHMSDAIDRLSAVATLTNELWWSGDHDTAKRKAILVAVSALGLLGKQELDEARDDLEATTLKFRANVTPEDVAAFDKAEAEEQAQERQKALIAQMVDLREWRTRLVETPEDMRKFLQADEPAERAKGGDHHAA